MEFTFTLKYQLPTHDIDTDVLIERLERKVVKMQW